MTKWRYFDGRAAGSEKKSPTKACSSGYYRLYYNDTMGDNRKPRSSEAKSTNKAKWDIHPMDIRDGSLTSLRKGRRTQTYPKPRLRSAARAPSHFLRTYIPFPATPNGHGSIGRDEMHDGAPTSGPERPERVQKHGISSLHMITQPRGTHSPRPQRPPYRPRDRGSRERPRK